MDKLKEIYTLSWQREQGPRSSQYRFTELWKNKWNLRLTLARLEQENIHDTLKLQHYTSTKIFGLVWEYNKRYKFYAPQTLYEKEKNTSIYGKKFTSRKVDNPVI